MSSLLLMLHAHGCCCCFCTAACCQVARLQASLRVASVERQQLEQRLQQLGDEASAQHIEACRSMDALRVQLATKEAAHR